MDPFPNQTQPSDLTIMISSSRIALEVLCYKKLKVTVATAGQVVLIITKKAMLIMNKIFYLQEFMAFYLSFMP